MKEVFTLTRILFKNSLNRNANDINIKKAMTKKILYFLGIAYIAFIIYQLSYNLIEVLQEFSKENLFISICLTLSITLSLFQAIIYSLNILYFSKDVEFLLPLPLKPIHIVMSKFNVLLIAEYFLEIMIFSIPIIVYGVLTSCNISFYFMVILVFLFLPIIPALIGTFITVFLMNFTKILKNKDLIQYVTVFLSIILVIALQKFFANNTEISSEALLQNLNKFELFKNNMIFLKQGESVILNQNYLDMAKLIAESMLSYLLILFIISKRYIKSANSLVAGGLKKAQKKLNFKKSTVSISYIKKEIKMLVRTPIFFLNTAFPILVLPLICAIPLYAEFASMPKEEMNILLSDINTYFETTFGFAVIICIMAFIYVFNFISLTAISRESQSCNFMKYIPIELYKQCRYKITLGVFLNLLPTLLIIIFLNMIINDVKIMFLGEIFIVSFLINILINYIMILIDILKPKLNWTSEQYVVKQNINILYAMISVVLLMAIISFIAQFFVNVHIYTICLIGMLIISIKFIENNLKNNIIFKEIN